MIRFEIHDTFDRVQVKIDGDLVWVRVPHMTVDQFIEFDLSMNRWRRMGARMVPERLLPEETLEVQVMTTDKDGNEVPELDKKTHKPVMQFTMTDEEVRIRRMRDMTPDQRDKYEETVERDERWARNFVLSTIRSYIQPEPDQIESVANGEDLVRYCHSQKQLTHELLGDVLLLNSVTPGQKKVLQSLLVSRSGSAPSSASVPTASGDAPAVTAARADDTASVPSEGATESVSTVTA